MCPAAQDEHLPDGTPKEQADSLRPGQDFSSFTPVGDIRILVLDDDEAICRFIQSALALHHFQVDTVSDPLRMQSCLNQGTYQIIILDYLIPKLPCEEVLEWVRTSQPEAAIIVVTGYPSLESALLCLRAHTFDYLLKPFSKQHLEQVVLCCLEQKGLLRLSEEALRTSLGAAIRDRRKALGLTLAQLGDRTGISLGYLSQIELGKNAASIETLYRISLGLGLKLIDLFKLVQPVL
jgi:CheY-like chemotaxis protein